MNIFQQVIPEVVRYSPNCKIILSTNPTEPLTYLALRISHFSRNRIIGLSGITDTARLRGFIAAELKVSAQDVSACILGQHGQAMVVIPRLTTVSGVPITEILSTDAIDRLIQHTIGGGHEINQLLKGKDNWSIYTPSAGLVQMAEAIIFNKKQILSCATYLQEEYGIKDTVLSVPVKLGAGGVEQVIELELTADEKAALVRSAKTIQEAISTMKLD